MSERQNLGDASVMFNDYLGTAAADDADALANIHSLYEVASLDRDQWTILSVDLGIWKNIPRVTIYAVDRARHNIKSHDDLQELGHTTGELPVTAFRLATSAQVEDFMNEAFKRIAVRLTARNVIDHKLAVDNHQEVNPTSDDRSATEG